MKLYWFPGACSQAPHIIAREANVPIELVRVDTKVGQIEGGGDYGELSPLLLVPVLELDDGTVLREAAVILQYLAEGKPELLAPWGTPERWRQMQWLNFVATEVHKTFRPLIKGASEDVKQYARDLLPPAFDVVARELEGREWLTGTHFGVVDAYFAVCFAWTRFVKFDTTRWPTLVDHLQRVRARPAARDALRAEGLLKT